MATATGCPRAAIRDRLAAAPILAALPGGYRSGTLVPNEPATPQMSETRARMIAFGQAYARSRKRGFPYGLYDPERRRYLR